MKNLFFLWFLGLSLWVSPQFPFPKIRKPVPHRAPISVLTVEEHILWQIPIAVQRLHEEEWQVFPGIGPALSRKLVGVKSLEEVDGIPGVGPKILTAIRPHLSFF